MTIMQNREPLHLTPLKCFNGINNLKLTKRKIISLSNVEGVFF